MCGDDHRGLESFLFSFVGDPWDEAVQMGGRFNQKLLIRYPNEKGT